MRDKSEHQAAVERFLVGIGRPVPDRPSVADVDLLATWGRLLLEETMEWIEAAGLEVVSAEDGGETFDRHGLTVRRAWRAAPDLVAMVDASADVSVVNTGCLSINGVADLDVLRTVDDNNLLKVATGRICPETGKFLKPLGHPKPDFAAALRRQGWAEEGGACD